MAIEVRLRRGTTAQHSTFTGAQGEVTVDITKKTLVAHDGVTAGGVPMLPASGGAVSGDIDFTGTGRRLSGDFSNATVGSRTIWRTNIANAATTFGIMPNGTGNGASIWLHATQDTTNAAIGTMYTNATEVGIAATRIGTGSYLPLAFYTSAAEALRIDTAGNVLAMRGALGYGVGSGGSVTQATNKSTGVALNKTTGTITMSNESLAAGATVWFSQTNSLATVADTVTATLTNEAVANPAAYDLDCLIGAGIIYYALRNRTGGALAEAVKINFTIHRGSRT